MKYAELDQPAQNVALDNVRLYLGTVLWGEQQNDQVARAIVFELAWQIGASNRFGYTEHDYPGIPDVTLSSWNLDEDVIWATGELSLENNAAFLSWEDGMGDHVTLHTKRNAIGFHTPENIPEQEKLDWQSVMRGEILNSLDVSLQTGHNEREQMLNDQSCLLWIQANDPNFEETGELIP